MLREFHRVYQGLLVNMKQLAGSQLIANERAQSLQLTGARLASERHKRMMDLDEFLAQNGVEKDALHLSNDASLLAVSFR